ncbi:MAG: tetratricopeptide repeat protein [Lacunisphaera sp.]|nr:tetratricopeptide repeat protein [Lacunisphaera sp.]
MTRRETIIAGVLVAIIAAGGWSALVVWRQQSHAAVAVAGVPPIPDLTRWPAEFKQLLRQESTAVGRARIPAEPLARLAALYQVNGFLGEAAQSLDALRRLEPKNALWPYRYADLSLRRGDKAAAAQALQATIERNPDYAPAWLRLAARQEEGAALEPARKSLQRALTLDPENPRMQHELLAFEFRHGGDPKALDQRLQALEVAHPRIKPLHELRVDLLTATGDLGEANRERRLAEESDLSLSTADPWLDSLTAHCFDSTQLLLRSVTLEREGRLDEEEKLLQQAAHLAPLAAANPYLWDMLANLYLKMERPAEARTVLETAVAQFPDEPEMHRLLAQLLRTVHQPETAIQVIGRAIRRWPELGALKEVLGGALRDAGRNAEAQVALREALRLDPTLTEAQYTLGCSLLEAGDRAGAQAAFAQTLMMRPEYPEALFALGAIRLEAGDPEGAEPLVLKLNALRPDEPNARYLLASLHWLKGLSAEKAGQPAAALAEYRAGLGAQPDYPALLREAGSLTLQLGRAAEAAVLLEHYTHAAPDDARGFLVLGAALQKAGRTEAARAAWAQGLGIARKADDQSAIEELSGRLAPAGKTKP